MKMNAGQGRRNVMGWYHETDNHKINECTAFSRLALQEKLEKVKEKKSLLFVPQDRSSIQKMQRQS